MLDLVQAIKSGQTCYATSEIKKWRNFESTELEDYAEKIKSINGCYIDPIRLATPSNIAVEKEAWLSGQITSPEFYYDEDMIAQMEMSGEQLKRLGTIRHYDERDKELIRNMLESRYRGLLANADIAKGILSYDTHLARHAIRTKYGELDDEVVAKAEDYAFTLLKRKNHEDHNRSLWSAPYIERLRNLQLNAEQLKQLLEDALEQYNFEWPVVISPETRYVEVQHKHPDGQRIVIPTGKVTDGITALCLVIRKVECQVRDAENGWELFGPLAFGLLRDDNVTLSNGHAIMAELDFRRKYLSEDKEYPVPWYILAMEYAQQGAGFYGTAEKLQHLWLEQLEDQEQAKKDTWRYVSRVFRGSQDLKPARGHKNIFIFLKDKSYFEGYLYAKALADADLWHWAEIGISDPEEIVKISSVFKITADDILHKKRHVIEKLAENLLK